VKGFLLATLDLDQLTFSVRDIVELDLVRAKAICPVDSLSSYLDGAEGPFGEFCLFVHLDTSNRLALGMVSTIHG
jgi:hypothetical protein